MCKHLINNDIIKKRHKFKSKKKKHKGDVKTYG